MCRSDLRAGAAALALTLCGSAFAKSYFEYESWLARPHRASAPAEIDADEAKRLARRDHCLRCHAVERSKAGPSFVAVAEKYRGKAGAADKLVAHITTGRRVRLPDGHWEEHKVTSTDDEAGIRNLVRWILAQ